MNKQEIVIEEARKDYSNGKTFTIEETFGDL